jgi:hypothetical protein
MLSPFSHAGPCALLCALVAGILAWIVLDVPPAQVGAVGAPVADCPCERPRVDLAVARAPESEPGATQIAVSRRDRFQGMTAELRDWHRAGQPGDLRADLQAATLAIRNLGDAGGVARLR